MNIFVSNNIKNAILETLKEKISKDFLEAFKARDTVKKNLLSVVKADITMQEKNTTVENLTDEEVSKILKKVAKNLVETISQSNSEEAKTELSVIESYLPKQMSEEEIRTEVEIIIIETKAIISDMGKVMTAFNGKFTGKADNKVVSTIVREILANKK